jgi:hypothetical protein
MITDQTMAINEMGRKDDQRILQDLQKRRADAGILAYVAIFIIIVIIMLLNLLV